MRREVILTLFFSWTTHLTIGVLVFTPRLIQDVAIGNLLRYTQIQKHTVFFHPEGSDDLYVGGTNIVYRIDLEQSHLVENYSLTPTGGQNCEVIPCENIITVIEQFQDSLFICGTNAYMPLCWKVYPRVGNDSSRVMKNREGIGISPPVYSQKSLSLTVEGDLYAATNLQFRRTLGNRISVSMHDKWLTEPTFVSASWIRRREDPDQEKIYIFFREKNLDSNPDADPWISRIAQICKVDEGGPKRFLQSIWTSFLKARLACGIRGESLFFNRLQDVFVQHADDWRASQVYTLFTSSWNASAVCVYSLDEIEAVFTKSSFRGLNKEIPNPRPGVCVTNSKEIPVDTLKVVRENPEMSDWIWPLHRQAPFYVSDTPYTRITVDTVTDVDGRPHNVLLLATDKGIIHKILEDNFTPFIISEMRLHHPAPVQSMKLISKKGKLLVGFRDQVAQLDLGSCRDYGTSCADCVLARDPYCAWSGSGCAPAVLGAIQNIDGGTVDVCPQSGTDQQRNRPPSPELLGVSHVLPMGVAFYMSCPVRSYHASYTWEHEGQSSPCVAAQREPQTQEDCLQLIPAVRAKHYGTHECVSVEQNYTRVLKSYRLLPPIENRARRAWWSSVTTSLSGLALVSILCH
ncbi:semaphorin-7A-like [Conger conger]|uniref:semaphorin-7A-like n=1 Tax=Conger conger TaxID=82655 RepID=UPI002A5AEB04|nr:semaphorin-7A-like [Conger conger]XP_061101809.1 semaphorin-7A-like [Conger conger]